MQALITAPGNTAVVAQIPIPEPGQGEIRIKVHSIALNHVDALYVAHPADKPGRVVGSDIAGVVDKLGDGVSRWSIGDRVASFVQGATTGTNRPGGFAEYAILEEDLATSIPSQVSFDEAATVPLCALTAAQALFIRLEINAPFSNPFKFPEPAVERPSILIYSAATSVGFYTIELARLLKAPTGESYRIFATASPKHTARLLSLGVEAVYDYRSPDWPERVLAASGGISYAVDCISEDETTARISRTFREGGGKIAVIRVQAWNKEGVRSDVTPLYGAVWQGLGREILYNDGTIPASPSWRSFSVAFYEWMSKSSSCWPISPNPVRLMPGGLSKVAEDGFKLLGSGRVADRMSEEGGQEWMRPISAEKLVYRIHSEPST
ncbi:zinc-binding oxidoreductase [Moniliophthora roreri]|nr:zinc-binding oxidoreductase [Moniliophthora roreri]